MRQKDPEEYKYLVENEPDNYYYHLQLGLVYQRQKKYSNAQREFEEARQLAPNNALPLFYLADLKIRQGKYGAAENFIKDLKYGMDFKHFPCQAINKNKAWGFMGIFAYNLMRFSSFLIDPRGCFLKRVRAKMVYIAGELRKGQRKLKIRVSNNIYQEVKRLEKKLHLRLSSLGCYRSVRGSPLPNYAL